MSFYVAARNEAMNAIAVDQLSLHSGFPGATGTSNEISGGTYARVSVTFGASADGVRNLSAPAVFNVPASTIAWVVAWGAGVPKFYSPNGGSPREFQVSTSLDEVRVPAHGYAADDPVVFYGGTIPAPLVEGTVYYCRNVTTDAFQLATSPGGAAINLTSTGATDCVVSRITLSVYGGVNTHTISNWGAGAVF